jgi:predicted ribosomally synthesized peptide with SipW-like signal peptide
MLHIAVLLCSVMAFGAVTLVAAPKHTSGLFTDSEVNDANPIATGTLAPATGLAAVPNGATQIDLSWTASASPYAAGYNVYRRTVDSCCYAFVTFVAGGGTTAYANGGLAAATTYYYVIETVYQNWASALSTQASAATP